jgi:hypothetical protein
MRVIARTLEYDSVPAANRARTSGSSRSRSATRTCSRAVAGATPTAHDSHSAGVRAPWRAQSLRITNSAISSNQRQVNAASCAAPVRRSYSICASLRSASSGSGPSRAASSNRRSHATSYAFT